MFTFIAIIAFLGLFTGLLALLAATEITRRTTATVNEKTQELQVALSSAVTLIDARLELLEKRMEKAERGVEASRVNSEQLRLIRQDLRELQGFFPRKKSAPKPKRLAA